MNKDTLKVGARVQYKPEDEDNWYTGSIELDSNGKLFIRDNCDESVTFYPTGNDTIREI